MSGPLASVTRKHAGSRLHERMIEAGWSPDEIEAIEGVLGSPVAADRGMASTGAGDFDEAA